MEFIKNLLDWRLFWCIIPGMNTTKFRTFFANAVCGTIPGKHRRDIVRIKIKYADYLKRCKKFAREHTDGPNKKIKIDVGARGHNLILLVGHDCAFKFPLHENGYEKSMRERKIIDAFARISPIQIPKMDVFQWGDIWVRKYEFATGVLLKKIKPGIVIQNRDKIADQLAKFIFAIGVSDPASLRDLKQDKNAKPGFMYGWFHNDIADNFTVDAHTLDIKYFIDWEDAQFTDYKLGFMYMRRNWDKCGFDGLYDAVVKKYRELYEKKSEQN